MTKQLHVYHPPSHLPYAHTHIHTCTVIHMHIQMHCIVWAAGVVITFVLQDDWSPLMVASEEGHVEVVKSLIQAGANINHTNKVGTHTILLHSIRCTPCIATQTMSSGNSQ